MSRIVRYLRAQALSPTRESALRWAQSQPWFRRLLEVKLASRPKPKMGHWVFLVVDPAGDRHE